MTNAIKARDVIEKLQLKPHPEGGYYPKYHKAGLLCHATMLHPLEIILH